MVVYSELHSWSFIFGAKKDGSCDYHLEKIRKEAKEKFCQNNFNRMDSLGGWQLLGLSVAIIIFC